MIPSILRTLVVLFLSAALLACGTSSSGSVRAGTT